MKPKTKEKSRGRPSILKDKALTEKYINIWIDSSYSKLPIWEITKKHDISKNTAKNAIAFVNKMFLKLPSEQLLKSAMFSIETRLKNLTAQLDLEYEKDEPSVRNIKELNSEIRADEIELNKLKNLFQEHFSMEVEGKGSIKQILEILSKKK